MGYAWPEASDLFPLGREVLDYMIGYAKTHHLLEHISFGCEVVSVVREQKESVDLYKLKVKQGEKFL